jgi:predicted DCC family thiol-disulfide oxidoreductase YuxK
MTPVAVLYDPDCGFCRVSLALLLRWDTRRRLRPVALGSEEADALLDGMPEDERMASWHLVEAGRVHSAGAASRPSSRDCREVGPLRG